MDEDEKQLTPEELASAFVSLAAEGDLYAQKGFYHKAIEAYTKAITLKPQDKNCLVSRSRCHLQVGDADASLMDAEESLKDNPNYFKGLFQKAEALYAKGDFEMALMFYHRGNKLRPELEEFRIGIQKCREAIENSIGDPKECKIVIASSQKKKVLSLFNSGNNSGTSSNKQHQQHHQQQGDRGTTGLPSTSQNSKQQRRIQSSPQTPSINPKNPTSVAAFLTHRGIAPPPASQLSPTMESKLLGDLYEDKAYLAQLLSDRDFLEHPNDAVLRLVSDGLRYFSTRLEFWRQQNPLYARHAHFVHLRNRKAENKRKHQMIVHDAQARKQQQQQQQNMFHNNNNNHNNGSVSGAVTPGGNSVVLPPIQ